MGIIIPFDYYPSGICTVKDNPILLKNKARERTGNEFGIIRNNENFTKTI